MTVKKSNKPVKAAHVSEKKKKAVTDLSKLLKEKKTFLIASIKNIPGSQFQEIVKRLRGKAIVKVPKKNLILKAIDTSKEEEIKKIGASITNDFALLFSDIDSYELAIDLISKKSPSKAKVGQIAPEDIEIPAGPTDLVPGPAISELGALGIQIQIEGGKITIKSPKVIAKKGTKITQAAADMMSKLDIKPFSIGFIPVAAFDNETKTFYADLNINPDQILEDFKEAYGRALPFAVQIGYATPETITFLIGKAGRQGIVLSNLQNKVQETQTDNSTNTPEVNSEENK
jgi:large subunit ribosomal protein L10